jgi:hypothetical protein
MKKVVIGDKVKVVTNQGIEDRCGWVGIVVNVVATKDETLCCLKFKDGSRRFYPIDQLEQTY